MQSSQNKNSFIVFIGVTLFVSGMLLLSNNYFNEKVDNAYSYMNSLLLDNQDNLPETEIQEEVINIDDSTSSFQQDDVLEPENSKEEYVDPYLKYYIGTLEIPKIGLKKGFTSIDSIHNTVSKNIEVVKGSKYPDVKNGNFILAAHSGSSYLAYFKNLYKLTNNDLAYVNYNGKKYVYKIVNIYEQEKNGKIAIYRDNKKTCLTLVTCTKDSKTKQTIYILELENVIDI